MISVGLLSFGFQGPATAPMAPSRSSVQMSKVGRNPGIEKLQVSNDATCLPVAAACVCFSWST